MSTRNRLLLALLAAIPLAATAQQPILFHNATLIDGTGAPPRPHTDILVRDGLIVAVTSAASHPASGVTVVDCTGKAVIPGLISAHSHLGLLQDNAAASPDAYTLPNVTASLNQFERYGVTTIVSLGLNKDLVYTLRSQQRQGQLGGATILTAGRGIGTPGGAPPFDLPPDQVDRPRTAAEARADVDRFAQLHTDIVKVWVDPLHGKMPEMSSDIYASVIDEAHADHLHVAAHEYALEDARQLVSDGVDVLAHSVRDQPVDDAFIRSMLQHHTWYIPTLALDEAFYIYATDPAIMRSEFFRQAAGPQLLAKLEAPGYRSNTLAAADTAQHQKDEAMARHNLKVFYDAGVSVAFGTDSGAVPGRIPGFSEHRELEDLVTAGLTPLQALTIATGDTGKLIHILDPTLNVGLISPGYSADLIVLTANPLADIRNTRRITAIYHRGKLIPNPAPQD
ncbi:amidohydrolase family protein [Granulicella sp. 5B5]|uniref:amidohydrolase family protein n=1 Tax=Granulicella sp. 5B5 TaxID=1617967 RepID=UPI0015F60861|nr:amidohydrolase family protein [Granulicella sp. 5B5]QMV17763.1 amidohydrolase family protein [Granulicella sp. 5B5]